MTVIVVDRPQDLKAALDSATGNVTLLLAPSATRYQMNNWYGLDTGGHVEIRPLDPDNPPVFDRIFLRNAHNVTIDGVKFYSPDVNRPSYWADFDIESSTGITLRNVEAESVGLTFFDPGDGSVRGNSFMKVRNSSDITIENTQIAHYFDGFSFQNVEGLVFRNNVLEKLQNDGLHGGQFVNALIEGNVFRDFIGVDAQFRHSDMIQIWSANSSGPTVGLTIRDNVFLSNASYANQTIFIQNLIDASQTDLYYRDILIENNLIYNGSTHAIYVDATAGLKILNNTIIWDQVAVNWDGEEAKNAVPRVRVRDSSTDVDIEGNVLAWPVAYAPGVSGRNVIVSYDGPGAEPRADSVFVGAFGASDLAHLAFRPDGALAGSGMGASVSVFDASPDGLVPAFSSVSLRGVETLMRFDARLSAGPDGLLDPATTSYLWRLPDGTTRTGPVIEHDFGADGRHAVTLEVTDAAGRTASATRLLDAAQSLRFELAFTDAGPTDASTYVTPFKKIDAAAVVDLGTEQVYRVSAATPLEISTGKGNLSRFDQFALVLDVRPDAAVSSAQSLVYLHGGLNALIRPDGELEVRLTTDQGSTFTLVTRGAGLAAGSWSHVVLSFDSHAGVLAAFVDGVAVGTTAASGWTTLASGASWVIGHPWLAGFEGLVRTVEIHDDPFDAALAAAVFAQARGQSGPVGGDGDTSNGGNGGNDDGGNGNGGNGDQGGGGQSGGGGASPVPPAGTGLVGTAGDDVLVFNTGRPDAWGGAGADVFRIDARGFPDDVTLTVHDFDPAQGDRLELRHFETATFDDGLDPGNALATRFGGRHADVDSLADLREIAAGAASLSETADGDAVLVLPGPDGRVTLTLEGISLAAILGGASAPGTAPAVPGGTHLVGSAATDTLVFRGELTTAWGGAGADVFRLDARAVGDAQTIIVHDFRPGDGDRIELRHFYADSFFETADPSNQLDVRFGGRHADVDSLADLREIVDGPVGLDQTATGDAVLVLPKEGGLIRLVLAGIDHDLLA